ncbi:MAG TPA: type II secretion system F family protein [Nakamurella sp.]
MSLYPVLAAVCAAVAVIGLFMLGVGIYGRPPTESPFTPRLSLVRAGGAWTTARPRLTRITVAVVAGVAVWLVSGWPVAAALTVAGILGLPYFFGASRAAKRRIERLEALEEWTRRLADTMAVGVAPVQALVRSADHAPAAIRAEVSALANALSTPRLDRGVVLRRFADEINDSLGDMIAMSLEIAVSAQASHRVPDVLRTMAAGVAEEVKARRAVEADRAGPRNEAKMIVIVSGVVRDRGGDPDQLHQDLRHADRSTGPRGLGCRCCARVVAAAEVLLRR